MRRRYAYSLIGTCLLAVSGNTASASASAKRGHPPQRACPTHPRGLVAANGQAEVYIARPPFSSPHARSYYGCAFRSRRVRFLGDIRLAGEGAADTRNLQLVGTVVAAESFLAVKEMGDSYTIVVTNLARPRGPVRTLATGTLTPAQHMNNTGLFGVGPTTALVVKNDSAVAWIVNDNAAPDAPTYEVVKSDASGPPVVLATGTDIAPDSLALSGSTLYWTQGNTPHSGTLN